MRTRALTLALALLAAACSSNSTPIPIIPSATVKSLSISGPATIAPGATMAFTATAQLSSGVTEDYTTKVTWRTTNLAAVTIDAQGRATGKAGGEAQIVASISGAASRATVLVLPPDTYRLIGTVTEGGLPVSNATVAVTSGVGTGLSVLTDFGGGYRLYGVAGPIEVTVAKDGYTPVVQPLFVNTMAVMDVSISQANPRNLAGSYALTITMGATCSVYLTMAPLSADLRQRRYAATITDSGPVFRVDLSGANFIVKDGLGAGFSGRIEPNQITFTLGDGYYTPYPDIVESLADGQALMVVGSGTLAPAGNDITGSLTGGIYTGKPPFWYGIPTSGCSSNGSNGIQLAFARQPTASRIRR